MVSEPKPLPAGSGGWIGKELILWHPSLREKIVPNLEISIQIKKGIHNASFITKNVDHYELITEYPPFK